MIELDANGQIPRRDVRCRAYHVAGYKAGEAWAGIQFFSASGYPTEAQIEAYPTFCGWASPEILGDQRSSQPSDDSTSAAPARIRFALVEYQDRPHLDMWSSEHRRSQSDYADRDNFIAWVTDTMEPLPPARVPAVPTLAQQLEAMASQSEPLSISQRQLLRSVIKMLPDQE